MARIHKQSKILETARQRLGSAKTFEYQLYFSSTMTIADYESKIDSVAAQLDGYNQLLAELDQKLADIQREETELKEMNLRVLNMCGAQFGPDSKEYAMLGGIGPMERSRRRKTTKSSGAS